MSIKIITNIMLFILALVAIFIILQRSSVVSKIFNKEKAESVTQKAMNDDVVSTGIVPEFLVKSFPNTDWSKVNTESINNILGGGPAKDGIPALDEPKFEPVKNFKHGDDVQAVVIKDGDGVKVYPYNILTWHEIVNDTVDGVPLSITFCPLCGSAVVYDRTLPQGVTTFGVSGFLLESNMVMYDRDTESLWQQSTGEAIAGEYLGTELKHVKFQLLSMSDVRSKYKNAQVLSEDTGYSRAYNRNPYAGYGENEDFIFRPSSLDVCYSPKSIFVIAKIGGISMSMPWLMLKDGNTYTTEVDGNKISIIKEGGELSIKDKNGKEIPFYFEMWFSWAVQNQDTGIVFDPSK